jgi:GH15 family glucan-1,4-alpha-glucosidase
MYELEQVLDRTREGTLHVLWAPSGEMVGSTDQGWTRGELVDACRRLNQARLSG